MQEEKMKTCSICRASYHPEEEMATEDICINCASAIISDDEIPPNL
jgi:hypothetical protein